MCIVIEMAMAMALADFIVFEILSVSDLTSDTNGMNFSEG